MFHRLRMQSLPAFALILLASCGGDAFEIKVSRPPNQRPDLADDAFDRGPIRLPSGEPFNYVSPASQENGVCQAHSTADKSGKATATITSEDGGAGWAEFQVGYTFDQKGSRTLGAVVELTVDYIQEISASTESVDNAVRVSLVFMVKDTNGTTQHSETLISNTNEGGARNWSAKQTLEVDATFAPDLGYYVLVAGRVDAAAPPGQKASGRLELKQCEMSITWKDAPVAAGGDDKPPTATR